MKYFPCVQAKGSKGVSVAPERVTRRRQGNRQISQLFKLLHGGEYKKVGRHTVCTCQAGDKDTGYIGAVMVKKTVSFKAARQNIKPLPASDRTIKNISNLKVRIKA